MIFKGNRRITEKSEYMKNTTKLSYLENLVDKVMALGLTLVILGVLLGLYVLLSSNSDLLIRSLF